MVRVIQPRLTTTTTIRVAPPCCRCCVCRELTKLHEEFYRGTLSDALAEFTQREPRGEIVLLVEGGAGGAGGAAGRWTEEQVVSRLRTLATDLGPRFRINDVSKMLAEDRSVGWKKKEIYQLWLDKGAAAS